MCVIRPSSLHICVYFTALYMYLFMDLAFGQFTLDNTSGSTLLDFTEDELDCPDENSRFITNTSHVIPWGLSQRALRTLPPGIHIKPSRIPEAGLGVFSDTFIPRYTWLGEYEGEVVTPDKGEDISEYTWTVHRGGRVAHYVDGGSVDTSNYLRFVNAPLNTNHENVQVMECYGHIYYMITKDIAPGAELLMYYGDDYMAAMGLDMEYYFSNVP